MRKLNIAVIGSGIAGLSAAWLLSKNHHVTLLEKEDYPGGHSNTRTVKTGDGEIPVDTGFIVYNEENYPNLTAFYQHLGVDTSPSNMSFSYSQNEGRYEYSGTGAKGIFGQKSNLFNYGHWHMLRDIRRFFASAPTVIARYSETTTLGEFLDAENYSRAFREDHILPMAAAIWSSPAADIEAFPAKSFIDFYSNHGLLKLRKRPPWRTVTGGSKEYVAKILDDTNITVKLANPVKRVRRLTDKVEIYDQFGVQSYDQVVFACHGDIALRLIDEPTRAENHVLGEFQYSDNKVILHDDNRFMPKRRHIWCSWNYNNAKKHERNETSITYWMNRLQPLQTKTDLFVTVNPNQSVDPDRILYQTMCRHPVMDVNSIKAQKELWQLQGVKRSWFCGSYFGFGFHEDALQSGLAVGEDLGGIKRPWTVPNDSGRIQRFNNEYAQAAE